MIDPNSAEQWPNFIDVPKLGQQRSVLALQRFLRAGERFLADNAFEEVGVAELAAAAESSVGTFYRIFDDKETLLLLIVQQFFTDVVAEVDALETGKDSHADLASYLQHLVDTLVGIYSGRSGVLRATILRSSKSLAFRENVHRLNDYLGASVQRSLASCSKEIRHPLGLEAGSLALHMLLGVLNQHTMTGSLGQMSDTDLRSELLRLIRAYLIFSDPV